jgi:undecaprenyl-diphosphatase
VVFAVLLPFFAVGYLAFRQRWRRLVIAVVAAAAAIGVLALVEAELVSRFSEPNLPFAPPSWICPTDGGIGEACLSAGVGFPNIYYLAAGVAVFSTLYPWMTKGWRRFGWWVVGILGFTRMIDGLEPPTDELLAAAIGYIVGAGVLLAIGMPNRRPRGLQVVEAMGRSGIDLAELRRAGVDARGSTPYFARTRDGEPLFIKVLSPEERAADVMFRTFRMFRLKGVGDERPFSSLKRGVEHEAVGSLKASSDGVQTPRLAAVAEVEPNSMLMAYEMIDGSSLDGVPAEDLTDEVLQQVWRLVGSLRRRRTAHRDLRLANVFLAADGEPWLIDFGFAELAATDGQLRSDVAELLTSTATVIGAERAVANAVAGIGPEAVADSASRIQPLALSGATRDALKHQKGLDKEIQEEIKRQTGIEAVELEDLERVKTSTIMTFVGLGLAVYFLIPQIVEVDFDQILGANWAWAAAALLASVLTYIAAAWILMGSVPDRLGIVTTTLAQFGATFINRIVPVKVGGLATNLLYLQRSGVDPAVAAAGLGVSNLGTIAVHMSLLVLFTALVGRNASEFIELPSGSVLLAVLGGLLVVGALVYVLPPSRKLFREKVLPLAKRSGQGLREVLTSPRNALLLFGGAFVMILSYITALWFSLEAFGGGLGFFAVGFVFLAGQAVGQAAPTPGGVGAVEAVMIASMTAMGLESQVAVPTVFLYRFATFWIPVLPGFFALKKLQRDGLL